MTLLSSKLLFSLSVYTCWQCGCCETEHSLPALRFCSQSCTKENHQAKVIYSMLNIEDSSSNISNRFRMTSLETSGEIVSKHDTGVMQINLAQDEVILLWPVNTAPDRLVCVLGQESSILSLGPSTQFPFYVSVNMMLTSIDSLNSLTD